ncbi:MAG TPA: DUF6519 domain-containing protein [Stellaceae bacterium]|nr:DUF6519 domain-containing protein [Stellaceae bacterium]
MAGDYTRLRFDPKNDGSGILQQQGRVMLDQDWNEQVELVRRRIRAGTLDTVGAGVVPLQTPEGFHIQLTAANDLTIGVGRIYVDGLLAENHGTGPTVYDAKLDEQVGSQPIPYEQQPYLPTPWTLPGPNPFQLPQPPDNGPHLVYLDVWTREETWLQDPLLIEKAVGVDTVTRLQTAWQVRVLKDVGTGVNCATPDDQIPGWAAATARSAGLLTTAAAGVPQSTDPCTIPADGGYRGTENRTYRVEIHTPGGFGTAQFKWSRNNASFATQVTAINATGTVLTVVMTKRDSVVRFAAGAWVEVTDDIHEFAGVAGEMHQVQVVDDVNLTITLATALTTGMFDPTHPERHTRVTLWDESGTVRDPNNNIIVDVDTNGGLIPVLQNTTVVLEDGLQISFGLDPAITGGTFHARDFWVFTARAVDASVEILTNVPPRGIHHHYCRLAVVTFPNSPADCRSFWPPSLGGDCGCDACVTAQSHNQGIFTIQTAIEQVKSGGRVCIGPGVYVLSETITLSGVQSVELAGHGNPVLLAPTAQAQATQPVILIDGSTGVTVQDLTIGMAPAIAFDPRQNVILFPGIMLQNSAFVTVTRCGFISIENTVAGNPAIAVGGFLSEATISDNAVSFLTADQQGNLSPGPGTGLARLPTLGGDNSIDFLLSLDFYVRDNFLQCGSSGVNLDALCWHVWQVEVSGNFIGPTAVSGINLAGIGLPAPSSRVEISRNEVIGSGDGIVCGVSAARIVDNDILSSTAAGAAGGGGVILDATLIPMTLDGCEITGNRIVGVGGVGIELRPMLGTVVITGNLVETAGGGGIVMSRGNSAQQLRIAGNQLLGLIPSIANPDVVALNVAAGILLTAVGLVEIEGNVIKDFALDTTGNISRVGISLIACKSVRIAGNQVINIGPASVTFGPSAGIAVTGPPFDRAEVVDNIIRRSDSVTQATDSTIWRALYIGPLAAFGESAVFSVIPLADNQFLLVSDAAAFAVNEGQQQATVHGNFMEALSIAPAAEVSTTGTCIFTSNQCLLHAPNFFRAAAGERAGEPSSFFPGNTAVLLAAPSVIASNNFVTGGFLNLDIAASTPFTALGNITGNLMRLGGAALPAPWNALNV